MLLFKFRNLKRHSRELSYLRVERIIIVCIIQLTDVQISLIVVDKFGIRVLGVRWSERNADYTLLCRRSFLRLGTELENSLPRV